MISTFRHYLEKWYVRAFFMLMVASFVLWGVDDMIRVVNTSTWAVKVAGTTIEARTLDGEFRRALTTASRELPRGQEISPQMRKQVGEQTLRRLISQAAMSVQLRDMRVVVPTEAVLDAIRTIPAFKGTGGTFDRTRFDMALRNNGLTEAGFMDLMRGDLARRQLLDAVAAASRVPNVEAAPIYEARYEKRSADIVGFPFARMPEPPNPDDAALRRWYDNHLDLYTNPERRRIKLIVLSTRTVAPEITVPDKDIVAAYEQHRDEYTTIARRSAQVISAGDEARAKALADTWRAGAGWDAMEAAAKEAGAAAIVRDDATEQEFPDPDLAKTVFGSALDTVTPPVKGALGWFVVKVTKAVEGGTAPFEEIREQVKQRVLTDRALELVYDRANKIDGQLANGGALDALTGDTGVTAIAVDMDRRGFAPDQAPVVIPGEEEIRAAILAAAFDATKGDPPHLTEVQTPSSGGSGYFALGVEDVTPSSPRPFESVRDAAAEDWRADQRRHSAELAAAAMLAAVNGGKDFSEAAKDSGLIPVLSPVVSRTQADPGLPIEVHKVLFTLKKGEATMVETPEGFLVAAPVEIIPPDAKADIATFEQVRAAVSKSVMNDIVTAYSDALRLRANPVINQTNIDQIVQP